MLRLINDILDLAKVESGKLEVIQKEVELQDVQDYVLKQFSPIAGQKEIQFTIQLEPDCQSMFIRISIVYSKF